ncbi:MAG: DNA polymerase III subunit gamma/tau, partial [Chloroflexi bacterium]|nr:DNA polymerase III subunit gamma/tau [Chloroflexota bacterium]
MATQALYNKWRAQTFDQVLGQEHITRTLRNQIKAGRIGHAYLFTGLRGTGKTSTARILAKAVNCVGDVAEPPCNACPICRSITQSASLDLIEIDAASNRGIDEIRDLRDRVHFVPHQCRYKVYVIDEVHMLTTEAFNALLKTLEEPPPHVIFVLCTTEPHRLPDTILSRCQRFDFRRISVETLVHKLRLISKEEGIAVAPDALEFIARRATGSFRDAESLLDQLAVYGADEITLDLVQRALGSVSWALVCRLVEALVRGDIPTGLRAINQAMDAGAEPRQFLSDILDHLRALLYLGVGGDESLEYLGVESLAAMRALASRDGFSLGAIVRAIRLFNEAGQGLRGAARPQLPLELALVESALVADGDAAQAPSSRSRGQPEPAVGAAVAPGPAVARGASEAVVEATPAPLAGNRPPVGALTAEAEAPPRAISAEPPARAASAPTPESETAQANREMVAEHTVEAPT